MSLDDPYRQMCDTADEDALEFLQPGAREPNLSQRLEWLAVLAGRTDGGLALLANVHRLRAAIMGDAQWKTCHLNAARWYSEEIDRLEQQATVLTIELGGDPDQNERAGLVGSIRELLLTAHGSLVRSMTYEVMLHVLEEIGAHTECDRELDELERRTTNPRQRQYVFDLRAQICRRRGDAAREAIYLLAIHEEATTDVGALVTLWDYLLATGDSSPALQNRFAEIAHQLADDPERMIWLL